MKRLLLLSSFLILVSSFRASGQSVGQYELRKRGASGFTSYGVTLSNGQVIGQTAGIPAAITPFDGAFSSLTGTPTTLAGYGITNALAVANNLSDLASAATARTNLGLGSTSSPSFQDISSTNGTQTMQIVSGTRLRWSVEPSIYFTNLEAAAATAQRTLTLPDATGTLITTGNLSAITTTGTITSGTWNGTAIGLGYIAQGGATSGQVLSWNGTTWAPAASGSGLTIGTTTITSGTSGRILYNNGGVVGEMTTSGSGTELALTTSPTFVTPALGVASATDLSTTGRFYGASQPGYPQFTETGYSGNGMRVYSDRLDFWISSAVVYTVQAAFVNYGSAGMAWGTNSQLYGNSDGTGRLVQRVGTAAQAFSVANTYTSFTNKEEVELGWTSNLAHLWTVKGSGGGTARDLVLGTDSTERIRLSSSGLTIGSGGSAISKVLTATATLDFGSIAAQTSADLTITVTGAAAGEACVMGLPASADSGIVFNAIVTSSNTVTIRASNVTSGAIDPASATFRATVIQH